MNYESYDDPKYKEYQSKTDPVAAFVVVVATMCVLSAAVMFVVALANGWYR